MKCFQLCHKGEKPPLGRTQPDYHDHDDNVDDKEVLFKRMMKMMMTLMMKLTKMMALMMRMTMMMIRRMMKTMLMNCYLPN